MKIGLVSCGKKKLLYPAPARELYQGDLFKKASRYAQGNYDYWFILSALHGLVAPDTALEPYDVTLNDASAKERRVWASRVYDQICELGLQNEQFYVHAGDMYQGVCKYLQNCMFPVSGLGIGQQLRWYKERGY